MSNAKMKNDETAFRFVIQAFVYSDFIRHSDFVLSSHFRFVNTTVSHRSGDVSL